MKRSLIRATRPLDIQTVRSTREQREIERLAARAFGRPLPNQPETDHPKRLACGCWTDALRDDCGHEEKA